jgi:hypothetical protein
MDKIWVFPVQSSYIVVEVVSYPNPVSDILNIKIDGESVDKLK